MKPREIGDFVHKRIMARMAEGDGDYWTVYHQILSEDPDLRAIYAGLQTKTIRGPEISPSAETSQAAGSELDKLTRQFMFEMNVDDYEWALRQIMKANPQLTKRYTQS